MSEPRAETERWVVANGAGWTNLGDDLIASATSELIRRRPGARASVLGGPAQPYFPDLDVELSRLGRGAIPQLAWAGRPGAGAAFVVGGGGLIASRPPGFYRPFLRFCRLVDALRRPFSLFAVGVVAPTGPDADAAYRWLFTNAAHVSVRDRASADIARSYREHGPVFVTGDPVELIAQNRRLPAADADRGSSAGGAADPVGHRSALLNLRPWWHLPTVWSDPERRGYEEFASAVIAGMGRRTSIDFLPMVLEGPDSDVEVGGRLGEIPGAAVTCRVPPSLAAICDTIAGADVVVTMRLHLLILCAALGVPSIPLAYDSKMVAFARRFGLDAVLDISEARTPGEGAAAVSAFLSTALRRPASRLVTPQNSCAEAIADIAGHAGLANPLVDQTMR